MIDHPMLRDAAEAGMRLGLGRMRSFLAWLGEPHRAAPVLHVAGTNGKGSVARMLGAVLQARGLRVGVHTSPHLVHVNERILVDDEPVPDAVLESLLARLDLARAAWAREHLGPGERHPLTYFELTTAAAFQHFADAKVDVMVVEVGMGGRLDATNVVDPVVTGIVTIGLDHCEQLGFDHASIAAEKAGILKRGVPAVIGPLPYDALPVVRSVAAEKEAPLFLWGQDYEALGTAADVRYRGPVERTGLVLGLQGHHQVVNAGVALRMLDALPEALRPDEVAIRAGLRAARNPGRLEWLAPDLLLDGAHNPDGATALARALGELPHDRPRTLVIGGGTDKDIRSVAAALAPQVDHIRTTACDHPKARSPEDVAEQIAGLHPDIQVAGPMAEAVDRARDGQGLVIVAGSLYLVGAARGHVLGLGAR